MTEFADWQHDFVEALQDAGLAPGQAHRYSPAMVFESDARELWRRGYSIHLAVMHELLGPDCPQFRAALRKEPRP